jgi:hypothetical protein
MAFSEAENTDIRRFCGYPAHGVGGLLQGWRYYQVYGLLEYRLLHLSGSEETVVRHYLTTLSALERAVVEASGNLDTDQAAVWTHNRDEVRDRVRLFDDWRRRLAGFLGVPPGPALGTGGVALVV